MKIFLRKIFSNFFFVSFLVLTIMIFKKPDAFFNPQLWAEDGTIFLSDQMYYGFSSVLNPYAGYILTIPRLCAALADLFKVNLIYIPAIYNFLSFLFLSIAIFIISNSTLSIPTYCKYLMGLSIIIVPHSGEVFMNITNLQWVLTLSSFIILIQKPPLIFSTQLFYLIWTLVVFLTGPFVIVYTPIILTRIVFLTRRNIKSRSSPILLNFQWYLPFLLFISVLSLLIQLSYILFYSDPSNPSSGQLTFSNQLDQNLSKGIYYLIINLFLSPNLGKHFNNLIIAYDLTRYAYSIISISAIMIFLFLEIYLFKVSKKEFFYLSLSFLFLAFLFIFVCYYRSYSIDPSVSIDNFVKSSFENKNRYSYVTSVFLSWYLILLTSSKSKTISLICSFLAFLVLLCSISSFSSISAQDCNWSSYVDKYNYHIVDEIPIPPDCSSWRVYGRYPRNQFSDSENF